MALSPNGEGTAAYAPTATITTTIDRYRKVGFAGQPITEITLQKIGISDSLIPRTLASLRGIDLIDQDGNPTDQFNVLKNAPTGEFKERLAEWLKFTYAPIFGFCDPTTASAAEIEDAFRGYKPEGQRPRMANLFMGLAAYAGIVEETPSKPRGRHAASASGKATTNGSANATLGGETKKKRVLRRHHEIHDDEKPPATGLDAYRQRYIDLLIAKAESQTEPDAELLDRIERALGIAAVKENST
jgi:hypothetical protein